MAKEHGDEFGLLWEEPIRVRRHERNGEQGIVRNIPVPETGWELPQNFPDLSSAKMIGVDTETKDPQLTSKGPGTFRGDSYIVGVSIATDDGFKAYYPVRHAKGPNLDPEIVFRWLKHELARPHQVKVGANLLYDMEQLAADGVELVGPLWDVLIAEPLIDENQFKYDLERIAQKYLGVGKTQDVMTDWICRSFGCSAAAAKGHIWEAPPQLVGPYAEDDADLPLKIIRHQLAEMDRQDEEERAARYTGPTLRSLFDTESELLPLMSHMRRTGVRVDLEAAQDAKNLYRKKYHDAMERLPGVDIWSSDSLARAFDKEGIPYNRTAKGAPSFRKDWLEGHPSDLAQTVMAARKYDKGVSTFVDSYIFGNHIDGRIHGQFHLLKSDEGGTVSGRFSSSNPNLQNIPARDPELGPACRRLFIPEEGMEWWSLDWSQIEYRIMVHYAEMMGLPGASAAAEQYRQNKGADFHQVCADLTGLKRSDAKHINFGIAYGQGIALLAIKLGVPVEVARDIMEAYHRGAPFLKELMNRCASRVQRTGRIRTLDGRFRRFDLWESKRWNSESSKEMLRYDAACQKWGKNKIRRAATHKALNGLAQGSAADIMKRAMRDAWKAGIFRVLVPHLTVHDELDGSKPRTREGDEALRELKHIMETCVTLRVPLIAEGSVGANWNAAK